MSKCKTYQVMPGEPQLGRVRECTETIEREDIVNELAEKFTDGTIVDEEDVNYQWEYNDTGVLLEVGEFLTKDEVRSIINTLNGTLLDDDWGTGKEFNMAYDLIDSMVDDNASVEYETQEFYR